MVSKGINNRRATYLRCILGDYKNGSLTKLVTSRWLYIGQVFLWTETDLRPINTQNKNEANIQPS